MVFPLCLACATQELTVCNHSMAKRCLVGTWTLVEISKAVELGYIIEVVYQLWSWDRWSDQVYKKYIDTFLKIKQEASGYPDWVKTPEDEQKFEDDYFESEGILLDHVEKNPGRRAFAKTILNCL